MKLERLNAEQKKIVFHTDGAVLVLGVAGSGKSRLIFHRVIHLIKDKNIDPAKILVFTSNNRVSRKTCSDLETYFGMDYSRLTTGTFHAICLEILREDIKHLGFCSTFGMYDTADRYTLIKECLMELNFDLDKTHPSLVSARISQAKNLNLSPKYVMKHAQTFSDRKIAKIYELYQERLRMLNSLDFDDLLMLVHELFLNHPGVLEKYQHRWSYIMIDDFQDVSQIQVGIAAALAQENENIMVLGDDDEAIYQWRGADPSFVETFTGYFPDAPKYILTKNYRSPVDIVKVANNLISFNKNRSDKNMVPARKKSRKVQVVIAEDERQEARFVAEKIQEFRNKKNYSFKDFAVLYRTNVQARVFENVFDETNVSYKIISGLGFFSKREIKDVLAYLRLTIVPEDDISLKRILNTPSRGVGVFEMKKLEMLSKQEKTSLFQAMKQLLSNTKYLTNKQIGLREFVDLMEYLFQMNGKHDVYEMLELVLDKTGYEEMVRSEGTIESEIQLANLHKFKQIMKEFVRTNIGNSVSHFLDWVSLLNQTDMYDDSEDVVTLMTFHCAKGLQFPIVFLVGMEEGLCPHRKSTTDESEMEEERRLCFVGMTRAQEELFCLCSRKRHHYGTVQTNPPSRFITEIPENFVSESFYSKDDSTRKKAFPQLEEKLRRKCVFTEGMHVKHPKWGMGTVLEVFEAGLDTKLLIHFPGVGNKKLIDKFVQPEIIST